MDARLVCKDLLGYLQELPTLLLARLYNSSAACLAVLRELPDLGKQYLMRLLFLEQAVPLSIVNSWPRPGTRSQSAHVDALTKLKSLRILETVPLPGAQEGLIVNSRFKANITVLTCGGGSAWANPGHHGEDKHARDIPFLDEYADRQWEGILNYLVQTRQTSEVSEEAMQVLMHAGLMGSSQPAFITTSGFQFLLMERKKQVWYFLLQYLRTAEERGLDLIECLNFIFQLSFSTLGKDYSTEGLTQGQLLFIQHLRQFGLVYQRRSSSKRYYPTKLIINISSGNGEDVDTSHKNGYIIVETNYRVLAYTNSQLQISILGLFCQLQYRFANMAVGTITRESIHQALISGITADQILKFLKKHSHSEMQKSVPVIPATVCDQVLLWERERDRLNFSEGVLYSEFLSANDFELVRKYAEDLGVLEWASSGKRLMVVSPSGHNDVRRFWRRQRQT